MSQARIEENTYESKFLKLQLQINLRQLFEHNHFYPPFSLHRTDLNFTDIEGNSLLHYAAAMGDLEKVKYCLQNQANINLKNDKKENAISIALENGHFAVVNYLFEQGASCANLDLTCC